MPSTNCRTAWASLGDAIDDRGGGVVAEEAAAEFVQLFINRRAQFDDDLLLHQPGRGDGMPEFKSHPQRGQ